MQRRNKKESKEMSADKYDIDGHIYVNVNKINVVNMPGSDDGFGSNFSMKKDQVFQKSFIMVVINGTEEKLVPLPPQSVEYILKLVGVISA